MIKVLITGSSGFVGSALSASVVASEKFDVLQVVRKKNSEINSNNYIVVGPFTADTDFTNALANVDVVIHLAGLAHMKNNFGSDLAKNFKTVNVDATYNLAKQSVAAGVKRFIYLSSIGVNGFKNDTPFTCFDSEQPMDNYSKSKYEAELVLKKLSHETDLEVVIIRPPLVYGKNAPGNFGKLLDIAKTNFPLPFPSINNQRSFVALDNLVDLITVCIDHPNAANQTFLVSDDEDISSSNMLKKLILSTGRQANLIPVPVCIIKFLASIFGKKEAVEKFSSSLTVDIEHTKKTLDWRPVITLDEGIRRCFL